VANQGRLPSPAKSAPATAPASDVAIGTLGRSVPKGLAGASPAVKRGKGLFVALMCSTCHSTNGTRLIGPSLLNVVGRSERLSDGTAVVADEAYLRESILDPQKRVVDGFPPLMPPMKDKVTDAQLGDLIAYLHFLSPGALPRCGSR
jgi:cytochrome c2